ncbi:MAG: 7TM domain-containing protein [Planctomycetota bacterium]|nr:7TM domain-containing protein [Planctomycetota bacterium]
MKHVWKTRLVILGLIILGAALTGYRYSVRKSRPLPPWESVWKLNVKIELGGSEKKQKVRLQAPKNSRSIRVFRESVSHPGMKVDVSSPPDRPREWVATTLGKGPGVLDVEFNLHVSPERNFPDRRTNKGLKPEQRAHFLKSSSKFPVENDQVLELLKTLNEGVGTRSKLLEKVYDYCHKTILTDEKSNFNSVKKALGNKRATSLGCARTMVTLCRAAKIPSRLVTGFEIKAAPSPKLIHWVQTKLGKGWANYDPNGGYAKDLPANYFILRRDGETVFQLSGVDGEESKTDFTIQRANMPDELTAAQKSKFTDIFELTRLPLNFQRILALLLLLPFGALVTAFFRNIVGIVTFGTFGPTLLALAFMYADWQTGLVMAIGILIVGVVLRYLLEPLRLLMIPRLGVILTVVVFCMVTGISVLDYLGLATEGQAVLLPMVILTGLIERLFITVEEDGGKNTLKRIGGTLLVGFCCFLVLNSKSVGRYLLIYPEIHFGTVALMVWVGRYSGYRLSELLRFKDLVDSMPGVDAPKPASTPETATESRKTEAAPEPPELAGDGDSEKVGGNS